VGSGEGSGQRNSRRGRRGRLLLGWSLFSKAAVAAESFKKKLAWLFSRNNRAVMFDIFAITLCGGLLALFVSLLSFP
jgi:hypothetical protein